MDSYRLIPLRIVLRLVALGSAIALVCWILNPLLMDTLAVSGQTFARYGGPLVEEALKGIVVVLAIGNKRIGFLVDAAIWGFAIGAGFAAVENTHFFWVLREPNLTLWIIRGFGTAVMHGGTTAILAVSAKHLAERLDSSRLLFFLPGFALAATIHSLYNHFFVSPSASTLILLIVLPLIFAVVFHVSETATKRWLGVGFDTDQELLRVIREGQISETRVGRYLLELKDHFANEIVADMLCLIRLHVELSIKAKGILLLQKAGLSAPQDPDMTARFDELKYLERTIGKTGLIALHPIFHTSSHDLWQLHMLGSK